jgi:hypothetical protein
VIEASKFRKRKEKGDGDMLQKIHAEGDNSITCSESIQIQTDMQLYPDHPNRHDRMTPIRPSAARGEEPNRELCGRKNLTCGVLNRVTSPLPSTFTNVTMRDECLPIPRFVSVTITKKHVHLLWEKTCPSARLDTASSYSLSENSDSQYWYTYVSR